MHLLQALQMMQFRFPMPSCPPPRLADQRREATARLIHEAALRLAAERGVEAVTAEAIAAEAGISPRTFFNYYPFKEAAIMGPPPSFPEPAAEAFATGRGPLRPALEALLAAHLARLGDRRSLVAQFLAIGPDNPRLMGLRLVALYGRRDALAALLARRLPELPAARRAILAHAVMAAAGSAVEDWAEGREDDLVATALARLDEVAPAAALLEDRG